jgi:hypothetical protein
MRIKSGIRKEKLGIRSQKLLKSGIRKEESGKLSRPDIPLPCQVIDS